MNKSILIFALAMTLNVSVSADEYDFRDDSRPTFEKAIDVAELSAIAGDDNVTILDVRLTEDFSADPQLIPGATYKNPEDIAQWSEALPQNAKVVVYCVKGKWVSQKAASFLDRMGIDAYTLTGGIEEWQARNNVDKD